MPNDREFVRRVTVDGQQGDVVFLSAINGHAVDESEATVAIVTFDGGKIAYYVVDQGAQRATPIS